MADSTALLSFRVFISTASLLPTCSMSCGKTAPLRPLNAFSNWRVRTVKKRCWRIRQRKWGSSRGVRFKRTVRCQFPSVQNYCFLARTKSQHIFPICSALNWKRKFFFVVFAGGRGELRSGSSELRGQVMDIYQEALDYLQSHHVAGETSRHQISM